MIEPTMAREGMRYWRLKPDARLRPWILCYWMVEPGLETTTDPDKLQLLIPDGHSEIVFMLAGGGWLVFHRGAVRAPATA